MKPEAQIELSKLQIVASLFASEYGDDLFFASQIKESIEAALPSEKKDDVTAFVAYAEQLHARVVRDPNASAISLVTALEDQDFSILSLRVRLLAALKRSCRFERPLVVLTGLREAICPHGARWTARRMQEYYDAIAFSRDFCHSRARPSAKLSLVIL